MLCKRGKQSPQKQDWNDTAVPPPCHSENRPRYKLTAQKALLHLNKLWMQQHSPWEKSVLLQTLQSLLLLWCSALQQPKTCSCLDANCSTSTEVHLNKEGSRQNQSPKLARHEMYRHWLHFSILAICTKMVPYYQQHQARVSFQHQSSSAFRPISSCKETSSKGKSLEPSATYWYSLRKFGFLLCSVWADTQVLWKPTVKACIGQNSGPSKGWGADEPYVCNYMWNIIIFEDISSHTHAHWKKPQAQGGLTSPRCFWDTWMPSRHVIPQNNQTNPASAEPAIKWMLKKASLLKSQTPQAE